MRELRPAGLFANETADAEELAPVGRRRLRIEPRLARLEAMLGIVDAARRDHRFAGGEVGLDGVGRRHAGRLRQRVGHRHGLVVRASSDGELHAKNFERPLEPAHGLRAERTVRVAGLTQILTGTLVRAAHQVNLRQRVEDRAGRLVELNRAAHFERAREDLLGAFEIAKLHVDLSERGQRDGQAVPRPERLVQRDAALGERQRLIVAMAHQRHVRLVVNDAREDVVGGDGHRQTLGLSQSGRGFVHTSRLRQQDRRQRVDEREMTSIAGRVQRRRRFREMVADDARVADLLVAEGQLVVGKTDRARVVRELGVLQRARMQRDRPRLLALGVRDPAMQAPESSRAARRRCAPEACRAVGQARSPPG